MPTSHHLLHISGGPDLEFTGRMIGQFAEPDGHSDKQERHEVRLWRTVGGAVIAECTIHFEDVSRPPRRRAGVMKGHFGDEPDEAQRREIMSFFDWSDEAKALAKRLGWDVAEHVP